MIYKPLCVFHCACLSLSSRHPEEVKDSMTLYGPWQTSQLELNSTTPDIKASLQLKHTLINTYISERSSQLPGAEFLAECTTSLLPYAPLSKQILQFVRKTEVISQAVFV